MNTADIILAVVIAAAVALAVRACIRRKKRGCGCGCCSENCPSSEGCRKDRAGG